jgi:aminopeptidase N
VSTLELDGRPAEFEHEGKDLVIDGDFVEDEQYELALAYSGSPEPVAAPTTRRDFSTTGFTVSDDGSAWTMQEPFGAYSWYAVNDHPSDKAFYGFVLSAPAPMTGVANGVMTSHEVEDGNTVTAWTLDSKTSSYLVTVAFGDYKVTEDESASGVPISYWVPTSSSRYLDRLRYTPDALAWVEDKLGPYPWSSLGILLVDSLSGMETQTMITLGSTDYATSKGVIVHELVHQWYGDRVTPSDWRDLWMNEGMAMYLQLNWHAEDTGTPLEEILELAAQRERRSRRVNGPPADYDPDTFGETQVYYGPALMWDQVRRRVGDEKFWEMVRAWPSVDPDGNSNRDEYLAWVEEFTGAELSDLFNGWLLAERSPPFE